MASLTNVAFAGYAYYSTGGEGFAYALSSKDTASVGLPVVYVNSNAKAAHFFSLLLLSVGGVLMVGLMCFVAVTFCCRRKVAVLEEMYWKLQYAFANVNDTLMREASRRAPSTAATSSASLNQKRASQPNIRLAAGTQSPSQMMQHHGSTASMTSIRQPQQMMEPPPAAPVFPATPLPYGMSVNPFHLQPVNASSASAYNYSYNDSCARSSLFAPQASPAPSTPQQTRVSGNLMASQSPRATPDQPLRRRASKVSFIGA
ncbi:hypothetical protein LSCM1_07412 [Leishmania martiniquensis]|uniref:Uncharacterized protein n=1 Tax=Leishmania martiniquensis TaxID=1580590 RepID=A0A836HJN7_9TRYP|nr:hypothetical protein LSCM1_07412 [Leishmania martiniquensis]